MANTLPTMKPVESSNVAAIGYDREGERFAVHFKGGQTYVYDGVPDKVAQDVITSKSIGAAVSAKIVKGGFAYNRIKKDDE